MGDAYGLRMRAARKVLIVCSQYYPQNSAGSHRVAKMAKYLPMFGWLPTVVCCGWNSENCFGNYDEDLLGNDYCRTIRIPFTEPSSRLMRGLSRRLRGVYPSVFHRKCLNSFLEQIHVLLSRERYDLILASCPPLLGLSVASRISCSHGIPWVADLRDLPDEDSNSRSFWIRCHLREETAMLRSAAVLITVSPPLAARLSTRHHQSVHVVYNGFDSDDFSGQSENRSATFDLVYCGRILLSRTPLVLLNALDHLQQNKGDSLHDFRLCFYGVTPDILGRLLLGHRCAERVFNMGTVSQAASLAAQRTASALLLLSHPSGVGIMTSKVFEYLGAKRPIISVPGDRGVTDDLLMETGAGFVAGSTQTAAEILTSWLSEWRAVGSLRYGGRISIIDKFTRKSQAGNLARVLDSVPGNCALQPTLPN